MADTKITSLTADTSPTYDDLIVTVTDPAGTPANRKVTLASHAAALNPTSTVASLAAAAWSGRLQFPSDGFSIYRDSGSANVPWGPLFPFTAPVSGDFAWINQDGCTLDTTYGGISLTDDSNAGAHGLKIRKKTAPATPYTITAAFLAWWHTINAGYFLFGLTFRQSGDGKLHVFSSEQQVVATTASTKRFLSAKFSSPTAINAAYDSDRISSPLVSPVQWMRIADDGANRILSVSGDGQHWQEIHSVGRTDYMTADEVGFFVNPYSLAGGVTLLSWKEA